MLYGAKSLAADLVKPMIAAFDATYAGIVGVPRVAAMLAVFTMEYPLPPVSIMRFATAFITLNDPTTLMSITCATQHPSSDRHETKLHHRTPVHAWPAGAQTVGGTTRAELAASAVSPPQARHAAVSAASVCAAHLLKVFSRVVLRIDHGALVASCDTTGSWPASRRRCASVPVHRC